MRNTKDLIKRQALILFGRNGYEGTSVNEISKLVGITKGTFYCHYESKEALFLTILIEQFSEFLDDMLKFVYALNDISTMDKLFLIFKRSTKYYMENQDAARFLMRFTYFPSEDIKEVIKNSTELCDLQKIMKDKLLELFQEGLYRGEIENKRNVNCLVGSYFWMCTTTGINILNYNSCTSLEELEATWDIYINGIKNK